MKRKTKHQQKRRPAFILVTVVAMIAVATVMLTRLATTSLNEAAIAIDEERMMRSRWVMASLRRYGLAQAESLFEQRDRQPATSSAEDLAILWRQVKLGGQTYWMIVADESAKLNIARLANERSASDTEQVGANLVPTKSRMTMTADSPAAKRWSEWFVPPQTDRLLDPRQLAEASQQMTLWGDGRLNVHRCDPDVLDELWRTLFGRTAPQLLHQARKQQPPPSAKGMIAALGLRESQTNLALSWLTDRSDCYSVWLFCESDRRIGPMQFVQWGSDGRLAQHRGYAY